jgi:pimeloyl-ACP methyl ester carboxylesterase
MWIVVIGCARTPPTPAFMPPGSGVVHLTTRDGVDLVADDYPQPDPGGAGLVLLHMNPQKFDRTDWPPSFVEQSYGQGFSVIVPDRRGAGDSGGVAEDAFEGPAGKYDVEACVKRLTADGAATIVILGASNGTTSMLDYAEWAPSEGLPAPIALGFLTGGTYTENNGSMAELPKVPAIFTYSTAERAWSEAQRPLDPGTWSFREYPDGAHGTKMFDAVPTFAQDLASFLAPFAGA